MKDAEAGQWWALIAVAGSILVVGLDLTVLNLVAVAFLMPRWCRSPCSPRRSASRRCGGSARWGAACGCCR